MPQFILCAGPNAQLVSDLQAAVAAREAHHRQTGHVVAIEPAPPTLRRIRRGGTEEHVATTAAEVITACRHIGSNGYAKLNGEAMDVTTAGMLVAVSEAIHRQTTHPDYWDKVEARFARIYGDGAGQQPQAALRWLVSFGWKLVN